MSRSTTWLDEIEGPHARQAIQLAGTPIAEASGAVIMLHGRGATAEGILDLARLIGAPAISFLAPQAAGSSWYPYRFLEARDLNEPGLSSAQAAIEKMLEKLEEAGIRNDKVALLGFSQGACLVTDYTALHPGKYGGIIGLSGGLIGDVIDPASYTGSLDGTPVYLGCSDIDPHIPVERVHETSKVLETLGAEVTTEIFPGMGHSINPAEIEQAQKIIRRLATH